MLATVSRVWSELASTDPYFSVLTRPIFRETSTEDLINRFYATGAAEADFVGNVMLRHCAGHEQRRTVLEYGCGPGRVSYWLSLDFERVVGVDISPEYLDLATRYMAAHNVSNFVPFRLTGFDDLAGLPQFDVLYSRYVLQHNPPPVIRMVLGRLLERLAPGGFAIFQVPTFGWNYSFRVARHLACAGRDQGHGDARVSAPGSE